MIMRGAPATESSDLHACSVWNQASRKVQYKHGPVQTDRAGGLGLGHTHNTHSTLSACLELVGSSRGPYVHEAPATESSALRAASISNAQPSLQRCLVIVAHGCCKGVIPAVKPAVMRLHRYRVMTWSQDGCMIGPAAEASALILGMNHHIR